MNSKIKEYIVIGLISVGIASIVIGYTAYQDFKYEQNREIAVQESMRRNRTKLIAHVKGTYSNIMDANDLGALVTHIENNYKVD